MFSLTSAAHCLNSMSQLVSLILISISIIANGQLDDHQSLSHHQEILVQPNGLARLDCKLPQISSNNKRAYSWLFQQSSTGGSKPHSICYESKCPSASSFGIQLDLDETGTYDLIISNVTYELNDGLYYCDYTDTNQESKQTINRVYRLTVLSK